VIVWVPVASDVVVQFATQSLPPPEANGRLLQPEMAAPSLVNETVPPPSLGSTNAWKVTDCPGYEVAVDAVKLAALGAP
jgi:hypothetical protein